MSVVETFQQRYERVVAGTLEMLATGTDTIAFSVAGARVAMDCAEGYDPDTDDYDHFHEVSALQIVWSIDRVDGFHWAGSIDLPLEPGTPTNANVQTLLGAAWERMSFDHQAWTLRDLEEQMDDIAEEAEHEQEQP